MDALTVADVLGASAAFDHERIVRSIGPAVVLVLEKEAPARMEMLASTEGEHEALREWTRSTPRVRHLLDVYFELKADEEGTEDSVRWEREDGHAERLDAGQRLSTLRVAG